METGPPLDLLFFFNFISATKNLLIKLKKVHREKPIQRLRGQLIGKVEG